MDKVKMDKTKKEMDEIDGTIDKYYDIETIVENYSLSCLSMSPHDLKTTRLKRYKSVKLVNINGLGVGQAHFITEDGHYLLLPWCYIVSMTPSSDVM